MAEGDFVNSTSIPLPTTPVVTGENEVHDPWPSVSPDAPWEMVREKFERTMTLADEMLVRLVGDDGASGYLGSLADLISTYAVPQYEDITLDLTTSAISVLSRPAPTTLEALDTNFGTFDVLAPVTSPLPSIDTSVLTPGVAPADPVGADIVWSESAAITTVYDAILVRILADLASGATGLDPLVEQAIYDRARARALVSNDKLYQDAEDYFAARGFELPPGALAARLAEASAEIARNELDLSEKVMIQAADLEQKNRQHSLQMAVELERIIRTSKDGENTRALEAAKAKVDTVIRVYSEKVRAYIAIEEAKKANIEAQVAVLQGVIEHNKGLIAVYSGQAEAFKVATEAKAAANDGLIEAFKGEVAGYEAETRAISANQQSIVEDNRARIAKADIELRRIVAQIDAGLRAYTAEVSIRERISADMAQIANQAVASMLNAVSANASIGYSGSESRSESYGHSESVNESHSFGSSISESHDYTHNPDV